MCLLVLMIIFGVLAETSLLIRDKVCVIRIAREGAREAAITGNLDAGKAKAEAAGQQYFPNAGERLNISIDAPAETDGKIHSVTCYVSYDHPVFSGAISILNSTEVVLDGEATFGWWDAAEE